jgi:hypothetical protein
MFASAGDEGTPHPRFVGHQEGNLKEKRKCPEMSH